MNIFSKAARGLNLTPAERAFRKLLQNWLLTAIAAGLTAGAQYVLGNGQVDLQKLLYLVVGAFLLSVLSAIQKYYTAQGDAPLALAATAAISQVEQHFSEPPAQPPLAPTPIKPVPQPIILPTIPNNTPLQLPQIPFPPVGTLYSGANSVPPGASQSFSFGDTGVVPVVPPMR